MKVKLVGSEADGFSLITDNNKDVEEVARIRHRKYTSGRTATWVLLVDIAHDEEASPRANPVHRNSKIPARLTPS